ncbi:MAG: pyridoxal phosphate-dependent aminotransferase [Ruminococcaceae bacterium]|nr:pyridoxal phosphate-dependent aminotransferase [Oscillospiraceae bacterium]
MYDFETRLSRKNTGASKWNGMYDYNPDIPDGIVPLSVADMEFKTAPEIVEGLVEYLKNDVVFCYSAPTQRYYDAVGNWMEKRHQWKVEEDWLVLTTGVVQAVYNALYAYTSPGDGVIVMTPVYHPFFSAITNNGCDIVKNSLICSDSGYEIDFDDLEEKAAVEKNKVLIFCSPHNPVGRVWTREEIEKVAEICLRNNVLVISDEIHFDLVMPGYKHIVMSDLSKEVAMNTITTTAISKTFNLAGLQSSNIFIPNEELREAYKLGKKKRSLSNLSTLGYQATIIAYETGEPWLEALIKKIDENKTLCEEFFKKEIPEVRVFELEGTYLQWWDFRAFGLDNDELEKFLYDDALLFLNQGYVFGEEGNGFQRVNLAAPTAVLEESLARLLSAYNKKIKK